ncbi:kinase-like protein [Neocallimastix californiae]|uniref:non-specific serine/threonine protein kinase n=1 Tax=Neocallimastix californiae TaxID=1754190 RepID=A0A1Y2CLU2_9FUNG|nr:kinase-like protein [Neocallimastix californiae]|eukprot:ORY47937.1 kinase-like protein [Neocallimastix californiae]
MFPKSLLDNSTSSSSSDDLSNPAIIAVISVIKKGYRTSDSVLFDLKSRYQNEYDEIEALGKGGFGQVYKARNRLDSQLYAIKKIKLQSKPKEFSSSFDLQAFENLKSFNSNNTTSTTTSNLSFLSAEDLRIVKRLKHLHKLKKKLKKSKRKDSFDSDTISDTSSEDEYDETNETDSEESNVSDDGNENSDKIFNSSSEELQQLNSNLDDDGSYSYSNNINVSHDVNFHSHGDSINEEIDPNNQESNNDFIISFTDTRNSESRNNSNDYLINMENLVSVHSNESNNSKNDDDTTNINSSEDSSYNPFSFRIDDESLSHNKISILQKRFGTINTSIIKPSEKKNKLMLYLIIQMELCSGQTLESWIHERNELTEKKEIYVDRRVIFKIFKQIVQAIAHVHWNGCIHRDVKPANVFLQDDYHILLGDFGLAKDVNFSVSPSKTETVPCSTTLVDNEDEMEETEVSFEFKEIKDSETKISSDNISKLHKFTSGVGTYIYASPEQLASSQGYDNKTDIYSLGILLFELLWPFKTGMERIKTLTNIRNGKFPENFVEKWPLELPFLRSLLNPDPTLRPTAQEILDSEVLNINYITPLYNNPTNLLNALDLRVTRVSLEPTENVTFDRTSSKERKKGHNKTMSNATKMIKNYGDCGACKQKDMAISSFRSQYIKTKEQMAYLEDSIEKASKRVWVVSIVTFILGCVITLGITLLILCRNGGLFNTSSTIYSEPSAIEIKSSLNTNNNFDSSAFVSEDTN